LALKWFEKKFRKGLDDALMFPEVERYAARVVGRTSRAPASKLDSGGDYGGSVDRPPHRMMTNLRRPRPGGYYSGAASGGLSTPGSVYAGGLGKLLSGSIMFSKDNRAVPTTGAAGSGGGGAKTVRRSTEQPVRTDSNFSAALSPVTVKKAWKVGKVTVGYGLTRNESLGRQSASIDLRPSDEQQRNSDQLVATPNAQRMSDSGTLRPFSNSGNEIKLNIFTSRSEPNVDIPLSPEDMSELSMKVMKVPEPSVNIVMGATTESNNVATVAKPSDVTIDITKLNRLNAVDTSYVHKKSSRKTVRLSIDENKEYNGEVLSTY